VGLDEIRVALGGQRERHDDRARDRRLLVADGHGALDVEERRRIAARRGRVGVEVELVDRSELPPRCPAKRRDLDRVQR
jgi:hypothetical protein